MKRKKGFINGLLSLLLVLSIVVFVLPLIEAAAFSEIKYNTCRKGDVDGNGIVDKNDLVTLSKHVAKITVITDDILTNGDMNSDGSINAQDLSALSALLNGQSDFSISNVSVNQQNGVIGSIFEWTVDTKGGQGKIEYYYELHKVDAVSAFGAIIDSNDTTIAATSEIYQEANYFCVNITEAGEYALTVYCRDEDGVICSKENVVAVTVTNLELSIHTVESNVENYAIEQSELTWTVTTMGGDAPIQYRYALLYNGSVVDSVSTDINTYTVPSCIPGTYQLQVACEDAYGVKKTVQTASVISYARDAVYPKAPHIYSINSVFDVSDNENAPAVFDNQSLSLEWESVSGVKEYGIDLYEKQNDAWVLIHNNGNIAGNSYMLHQSLFGNKTDTAQYRMGIYSKGISAGDIRYYYFAVKPDEANADIQLDGAYSTVWDLASAKTAARHFEVSTELDFTVTSNVDWITCVKGADGFVATVAENASRVKSRSGVITVDNGKKNVTIAVNQGRGQGAPVLLYPYLSADEENPSVRPVGGITLEFEEDDANYIGVRIYELFGTGEKKIVYENITAYDTEFLHITGTNKDGVFAAGKTYALELSGRYSTAYLENEIENDAEKSVYYIKMSSDGHEILVDGTDFCEITSYEGASVDLYATNAWTYSVDADWIHVEDYDRISYYKDIETVQIKFDPNYTESPRTGMVTFYCGDETAKICLTQDSWLPRIVYPTVSTDRNAPTTLPGNGLTIGTVYNHATYATYSNGSWSEENPWGSTTAAVYESEILIPNGHYDSGVLYRFTLYTGEYTTVYYAVFDSTQTQNYIILNDNGDDASSVERAVSSVKSQLDIKMKASGTWSVSSNTSWLSSSSSSGRKQTSWKTLTITAQANNTGKDRTGVLSFKLGSKVYATLTITQPASDYLELFAEDKEDSFDYIRYQPGMTFQNCDGSGETLGLSAWTNTTWSAVSNNSWITVDGKSSVDGVKSGKDIDIKLDENTGSSVRTGSITVSAGKVSKTVTITQVPGMSKPTLVSPNLSISSKNPSAVVYQDLTLKWNAVAGAAYYEIKVRPADDSLLLPDSNFYSYSLKIDSTGKSTYSHTIPKSALSLNADSYDYIAIYAYDAYGYSVYTRFYLMSSLGDAARINGTLTPVWNDATDIECTKEFTVHATSNWKIQSKSDWISVDRTSGADGDVLKVTLSPNTGAARSGQVVIAVGSTQTVLTVNQCAYLPMFPSFDSMFSEDPNEPTMIDERLSSIPVKWIYEPQSEGYQLRLQIFKSDTVESVIERVNCGSVGEYTFENLDLVPGMRYSITLVRTSHWGVTSKKCYFMIKDAEAYVEINNAEYLEREFDAEEDSCYVTVTSGGMWTAVAGEDWLMVDNEPITQADLDMDEYTTTDFASYSGMSGDRLYISALKNPGNTYRYGTVTVRSSGAEATIVIVQEPYYERAAIYSPVMADRRQDSVGLPYGNLTVRWNDAVGGAGTYQLILEEREEDSTYRYYDILEVQNIKKNSYTIPASKLKEGGYYCLTLCTDLVDGDEDDVPCYRYYFYVKYENELTVSANVDWDMNQKMVKISASASGGAGDYKYSYELICDGKQIKITDMEDWDYYTFPLTETGKYQVKVYCRDKADNDASYICNTYTLDSVVLDSVTLSRENWNASASGGTISLTVSSSQNWKLQSKPDWITYSAQTGSNGDTVTLTVTANTDAERYGTVLFTAGKASCGIQITQSGNVILHPTITYPTEGSSVDFADLTINWKTIDAADSYVVSMRDLTTDQLLIYHDQTTTNVYTVSRTYLINGHRYRAAVGAIIDGMIFWTECTFQVIDTQSESSVISGTVVSSLGNPIAGAEISIYMLSGDNKLAAAHIVSDDHGQWSAQKLLRGMSYFIEAKKEGYMISDFPTVTADTATISGIQITAVNYLEDEAGRLYLNTDLLEFSSSEDNDYITAQFYDGFYVQDNLDWIHVSQNAEDGTIVISVDENHTHHDDGYREGSIVFYKHNQRTRAAEQTSVMIRQDDPAKKIYVTYNAKTSVEVSNVEIFDEEKRKYNGTELRKNETYEYGDGTKKEWIIDQPMMIPCGTTLKIEGDLVIKAKITFEADISKNRYNILGRPVYDKNGNAVKDTTYAVISCTGNITVASGGILDMANGGKIEVLANNGLGGNFTFKSGTNHKEYLKNGKIFVDGDVEIKKNFYASGSNVFTITSGKETHKINMWNKLWGDQYFQDFCIRDQGIESLKLEEKFIVNGRFAVNNWNILLNTICNGKEFHLSPLWLNAYNADQEVINRAQVGLLRVLAEYAVEKTWLGVRMVTSCQKSKTYSYVASNGDVCEFSVYVDYWGYRKNDGFGMVTYSENGKDYMFLIGADCENIDQSILDFRKEVLEFTKGQLIDIMDDYVGIYKDAIKSLIAESLSLNTNVLNMAEKSATLLIEQLAKESDELEEYYEIMKKIK